MPKKSSQIAPGEVITQFQGYIAKLKQRHHIEEADQLADLIDADTRKTQGEIFLNSVRNIYETDEEFHWQLGFFFFFFEACRMYENITIQGELKQYDSFDAFLKGERDYLKYSPSWIHKMRAIYGHYVWNLGIEPGHPLYPALRAVENFDTLEIMKVVCTEETVEYWLLYASEKDAQGRTVNPKDKVSSQVEIWKERMNTQIIHKADVKPIRNLPRRSYRVSVHPSTRQPLFARDYRDVLPDAIPGDSEIEIIYRVKKWGYLPPEEETDAET